MKLDHGPMGPVHSASTVPILNIYIRKVERRATVASTPPSPLHPEVSSLTYDPKQFIAGPHSRDAPGEEFE